jgi:hypothetical protein
MANVDKLQKVGKLCKYRIGDLEGVETAFKIASQNSHERELVTDFSIVWCC